MEKYCHDCPSLARCRGYSLELDKVKRFRIAVALHAKGQLENTVVENMRKRYRIPPEQEMSLLEENDDCPAVLDAL